jgi:hypothetical protein
VVGTRAMIKSPDAAAEAWMQTLLSEPMHPQQDHPLGEMIMLPVLLVIALAAWTASFLTGKPVKH